MISLSELVKKTPVFLNDFNDEVGVFAEFSDVSELRYEARYGKDNEKAKSELLQQFEDWKILFASYTYEDYSGDAYVLMINKDGKLYENFGSHCSCYGLEGQWRPEETTLEAIDLRLKKGNEWRNNGYDNDLRKFLSEE